MQSLGSDGILTVRDANRHIQASMFQGRVWELIRECMKGKLSSNATVHAGNTGVLFQTLIT